MEFPGKGTKQTQQQFGYMTQLLGAVWVSASYAHMNIVGIAVDSELGCLWKTFQVPALF